MLKFCRHCSKDFEPQEYEFHVRRVVRRLSHHDKDIEDSLVERLLELNEKDED